MKTIGEQAKAFREARGWSVKEMAAACGTSRQNIETLEAKGDRTPRYIKELARVMGTKVDVLMEGRYRVGDAPIVEAPTLTAPQAEETRLEPDELLGSLRVLAKSVSSVDKATRSAVSHLVSMLIQEPEQLTNITSAIEKLLPSTNLARHSQDDRSTGQAITPVLLPTIFKKKESKSAKRVSVHGSGQT
jgi:transcriptional regulator with XRE-family HTH domain